MSLETKDLTDTNEIESKPESLQQKEIFNTFIAVHFPGEQLKALKEALMCAGYPICDTSWRDKNGKRHFFDGAAGLRKIFLELIYKDNVDQTIRDGIFKKLQEKIDARKKRLEECGDQIQEDLKGAGIQGFKEMLALLGYEPVGHMAWEKQGLRVEGPRGQILMQMRESSQEIIEAFSEARRQLQKAEEWGQEVNERIARRKQKEAEEKATRAAQREAQKKVAAEKEAEEKAAKVAQREAEKSAKALAGEGKKPAPKQRKPVEYSGIPLSIKTLTVPEYPKANRGALGAVRLKYRTDMSLERSEGVRLDEQILVYNALHMKIIDALNVPSQDEGIRGVLDELSGKLSRWFTDLQTMLGTGADPKEALKGNMDRILNQAVKNQPEELRGIIEGLKENIHQIISSC